MNDLVKVDSTVPFEHQDLCYAFIEAIAKEYGGKITIEQIKELRTIVRKNFEEAGKL